MLNGRQLERIDEELQVELSKPQGSNQEKKLVVKVTITRTLVFSETMGYLDSQMCRGDAYQMIV